MAGAPAVSEIEELRDALAAEKAEHAKTLEELDYQLAGIYQHVDAVRNAEEVRDHYRNLAATQAEELKTLRALILRLDWDNIHTHHGFRQGCPDCDLRDAVFAAALSPVTGDGE